MSEQKGFGDSRRFGQFPGGRPIKTFLNEDPLSGLDDRCATILAWHFCGGLHGAFLSISVSVYSLTLKVNTHFMNPEALASVNCVIPREKLNIKSLVAPRIPRTT